MSLSRSKNTVNILIKNMLDALIGGVSYWAFGWALAYGPHKNPFCGWGAFFAYQMPGSDYPMWFFQFVFAATAATIVSGSIAERVQFQAYFVYSVLITGIVYPPVSHWAWDNGERDCRISDFGIVGDSECTECVTNFLTLLNLPPFFFPYSIAEP